MICLIVRDREISRSYHFYFDVSCNPVEHRKKNSVLKFETKIFQEIERNDDRKFFKRIKKKIRKIFNEILNEEKYLMNSFTTAHILLPPTTLFLSFSSKMGTPEQSRVIVINPLFQAFFQFSSSTF